MRSPWVRVSAPGLPTWPALWFDPESRQAIVAARIPTWRSHINAMRATRVCILIVMASIASWLWKRYDIPRNEPDVLFVYLMVLLFIYPIVAFLMKGNLPAFFARRIFATRTKLWFSPEWIRFQSQLYEQPVLVWRWWNDRPVRCRFIIQANRDAAEFGSRTQGKPNEFSRRLQEATMIEMLVATGQQLQFTQEPGVDASLRSIPVTEACQERSNRLTTVYTAAAALTSRAQMISPASQVVSPTRTQGEGTDIDLT